MGRRVVWIDVRPGVSLGADAGVGWIATQLAPTARMSSSVGTMASVPQSRPMPCVEIVMPRTSVSSATVDPARARVKTRALIALDILE